MSELGHRGLVVLRGSPEDTAARAARIVKELSEDVVLQVTAPARAHGRIAPPHAVARLLGQAFDVVVIDAHGGLDPDLLGQCHGFVRGGGALVLRLDPPGGDDAIQRARLVVHPFTLADVGRRFGQRLDRVLAAAPPGLLWPEVPLGPARRTFSATSEQAAVVDLLRATFVQTPGTATALMADRGRGKSSALGLALHGVAGRVAVTAESPDAAREVFAHGPAGLTFVPVMELLGVGASYDLIVVDEAARLPVPVLERLVLANPRAHLAFATTVRGYEGTGRGFALRFLAWLGRHRPLTVHTLTEPIRWASDCPLERFVFDALVLDSTTSVVDIPAGPTTFVPTRESPPGAASAAAGGRAEGAGGTIVDRDALAAPEGEADLHALFGLLVHAHYRTTPSDLVRLLDAPNVSIHVARRGHQIAAATLLAREGAWPDALTAAVASGKTRIRAHAIPDALVAHMGHAEAGAMTIVRSVRIATHPELRRAGLAQALVEHVHTTLGPEVDLIGTLFGATAELVHFRRALGYVLVRVSASRGARTGEPSVLMLRPLTPRAEALVTALRAELARELPLQLELLQADGEVLLDPALASALALDLPRPAPLDAAAIRAAVEAYAFGQRTIESVATALTRFVTEHADRVAALPPTDRLLVEGRLAMRRSWSAVLAASGLPSHAAMMRALRRAVRRLILDLGAELSA